MCVWCMCRRKRERERERESESIVAIPWIFWHPESLHQSNGWTIYLTKHIFHCHPILLLVSIKKQNGSPEKAPFDKKDRLKLCTMKLVLGMLQARHTSAVLIGNIIHGIKKVSLLERCRRIFGLRLLNKISDKANGIWKWKELCRIYVVETGGG